MRRRCKPLLSHMVLLVASLIMIFPVICWFFSTFMTNYEISAGKFLPASFNPVNYINGWMIAGFPFSKYLGNSILIELFIVFGAVMTSGLVAFGFARIDFKFRNILFSILLMTLMLPSQVLVVTQYIMYSKWGLVNSYIPLILPFYFGGGAFFIFMLVQFIRGIPKELDEAATIDGASIFGIYWRIIFPLIRTSLVTVGMFAFIWSWDDFYTHLLYISSVQKFPVSLALRMFIDQYDVKWGQLLAISFLSIIPSVALFFSAQKQFIAGIATTGIKG